MSPKPPAPGVSAIGEDGTRVPIKQVARPRRGAPRDDVLADPSRGRTVPIGAAATPVGARRANRDVVEMPMPPTTKSRRHMVEFNSIDGNTYRIRLVLDGNKKNPLREFLANFLAIREMRLGGDPFDVYYGFRLKLADDDEQQLWPPLCSVPPLSQVLGGESLAYADGTSPEDDLLMRLQSSGALEKVSEIEQEEQETGFSMGVDEETE